MKTILITNKRDNITNDFQYKEYWKGRDFEIYACIPKAIQILRDYYGLKISISSSYRPNDPVYMPDAHRKTPPAIDCVTTDRAKWAEIRDKIREEFKNWMTSKLVKDIINTGTNVMIIENTCLHLHHRKVNLHQTNQYGGIYIGEWKPDGKAGVNTAYSFPTI